MGYTSGTDATGMRDLRAENISRIVTGFALQAYKMKPLTLVQTSNSWKETYYQESKAELAAKGTRTIKGVSRLAKFPYAEVLFTEQSKRLVKHALEGQISWEDAITNSIDVISRTLLRIGRGVAKSVDDDIWDVISESQTPNLINTVAIAVGHEWNSATGGNQDPIQNILDAIKEISIDNYDALGGNGKLLLNPTDFANLLGNASVRNAGQFWTSDVTRNGQVGRILGLDVIVSNTITADKAMVMIAKECATWKTAKALTVETITDPGIKFTIRAWEVGVCQLTNPEAVCLITNTAA